MADSDTIWVLVDTQHPDANPIFGEGQKQHRGRWPVRFLSVTVSDDGNQALVKIADGQDSGWRADPQIAALLSGAATLRIYTASNHAQALTLLRTAAWSRVWSESPSSETLKARQVREHVEDLRDNWVPPAPGPTP